MILFDLLGGDTGMVEEAEEVPEEDET